MKFKPIFLSALLIVTCLLIVSCNSCKHDGQKSTATILHYNVTIAADLSNRLNAKLYPKAVVDSSIVNLVVDNIYPKILTHRRSMNQLDQFKVDFINKKQISAFNVHTQRLEIDFNRFGTKQAERISYLKNGFTKDAKSFKNEFQRTFERAVKDSYGSDIWTYFNEGIDNSIVDTSKTNSRFENHQFINQKKNVLILLTDGYIESGIYKEGFDLSSDKLKRFRSAFKNSGETDLNKFYKEHPEFYIKPINNPLLKDLNVLVLEMYDRTESNQGATIHPTDMEIMKVFWFDWLQRSKVKKVELHSKFSNIAEAEKVILKFLEV